MCTEHSDLERRNSASVGMFESQKSSIATIKKRKSDLLPLITLVNGIEHRQLGKFLPMLMNVLSSTIIESTITCLSKYSAFIEFDEDESFKCTLSHVFSIIKFEYFIKKYRWVFKQLKSGSKNNIFQHDFFCTIIKTFLNNEIVD